MKILNGKKLAGEILLSVKKEIKKSNLELTLVVIQVGENPVSQIFINQKKKACRQIGIGFRLYQFSARINPKNLKGKIKKIVEDPLNSGMILQLPLPKKFQPEEEFTNLIPEEKDIDVLSEKSLGKFYQGTLKILSPTVNGILRLLKDYKIKLKGKYVVVIGMGRLVGLPLTIQLLREFATPTVINIFTKDPAFFTQKADILISGAGKPNLIKGNMVKKGVVVIDAGTSLRRGKLVGDVNFKSVSKRASYITPVPGGVGPMTVACLIENLVKLNK